MRPKKNDQRIHQLEEDIKKAKIQLEQAKTNADRLEQMVMEEKALEEALEKHEETIREEKEVLQKENSKLEESNKKLEKNVKELKDNVKSLHDEVTGLGETKVKLENNVTELEQKAIELDHIAEKLNGVLAVIGNEVENLEEVEEKIFGTVKEIESNNHEQRRRQLRDIFDKFNVDYEDEKITKPEQIESLKNFLSSVYSAKMQQLELDLDADGEVTWDEFVEVLARDNFWHSEPPVQGQALLPSNAANKTILKEQLKEHKPNANATKPN